MTGMHGRQIDVYVLNHPIAVDELKKLAEKYGERVEADRSRDTHRSSR